jgi:hypothetical protein
MADAPQSAIDWVEAHVDAAGAGDRDLDAVCAAARAAGIPGHVAHRALKDLVTEGRVAPFIGTANPRRIRKTAAGRQPRAQRRGP